MRLIMVFDDSHPEDGVFFRSSAHHLYGSIGDKEIVTLVLAEYKASQTPAAKPEFAPEQVPVLPENQATK